MDGNIVKGGQDHYIQHPLFSREQLHNKSLYVVQQNSTIRRGRLSASEPRKDGRYVLTFQALAHLAQNNSMKPWAKVGEPKKDTGKIIVPPAEPLDQETVCKIRAVLSSDQLKGCDFVLPEA
jgi:hypothetical protein